MSKKCPSLARNALYPGVCYLSYVITVSKKRPSCAISKLGPNLMHEQIRHEVAVLSIKDGVLSLVEEV